MITGRQIRAARALLEWDAEDLALKASLSRDTVFNIEKGTTQARGGSIDKIVAAFNAGGIEFTDNQGVRLKPTGVEVYDGADRFDDFNTFLYEHLRTKGGDVCVQIYDETLIKKYRKDPEQHRNRMKSLVDRGNVTFRCITAKSDFVSHNYVSFRRLQSQAYTPTGFYAFGDCIALMSFMDQRSPHVVVIQSGALAEGYRETFNVAWANALPPPAPDTGVDVSISDGVSI